METVVPGLRLGAACYRVKKDWCRVDESSWNRSNRGYWEVLEIINRNVCVVSTPRSQFFLILARVLPAIDFRSALQRFRNASADILRANVAFEFGLLHQL